MDDAGTASLGWRIITDQSERTMYLIVHLAGYVMSVALYSPIFHFLQYCGGEVDESLEPFSHKQETQLSYHVLPFPDKSGILLLTPFVFGPELAYSHGMMNEKKRNEYVISAPNFDGDCLQQANFLELTRAMSTLGSV